MKSLKKRFRGLYWRQLFVTAGMVMLTLFLLGASFFSLSYNYARSQKSEELGEKAQMVAQIASGYLRTGQEEDLRQLATFAATVSEVDFLICDTEGHVGLSTDAAMEGLVVTMPEEMTREVLEEQISARRSDLNGFYEAKRFIVGVPIGILCAVFLARFCPARLYKVIKPAINLMAGIPSIVYGFFGLVVIVPVMQDIFPGTSGKSILTASILLGIMILPTIISVSESALRAVPESYHEGALALGATNERSSFTVILPAAKSGITAGVILGIGRAIGETMAVVMIAGNQAVIPGSLLEGARTLTANVVLEMGYAQGLHQEALIATAVVLFVFILIINLCFSLVKRKES